jgi:hypothetical protein
MRVPEKIELESDHGDRVEYQIAPWSAGEAIRNARKVLGILRGVGFSMPSGVNAGSILDADVGKILGLGLAGTDGNSGLLGAIADGLAEAGDDQLFRDLLAGVIRRIGGKGELVAGRGSKPTAFDSAYSANLGELLLVVYHVLRINFGPALRRMGGAEAKG